MHRVGILPGPRRPANPIARLEHVFPSLTNQQQVAVDHAGGHLLIVAGAGTGKTTTLA
jgi:hypothetical protein